MTDSRTLDGERLGTKRNDFLHGIAPHLDHSNPLVGKLDPSGKQSVYEFSHYIDMKIEEYKKAGKNPYDLFDPSKHDYLGKPEVLSGFQKTMAQSLKAFSERMQRQSDLSTATKKEERGSPARR